MTAILQERLGKLEILGRDLGLDYYPVSFEEVPDSFMMEIAVYGLPVRMPHWSFGVRYIYQLVQHRMGHSRLFEVVFPGNPGRAYLARNNSVQENTLVTAHVLGHADFSKNNELFRRSQDQLGYKIVELAASHARRIALAIEEHGEAKVERVLDAALALESHIDVFKGVRRSTAKNAEASTERDAPPEDAFKQRFRDLPGEQQGDAPKADENPEHGKRFAERDLLWFLAQEAPEMAAWERDIFLAVREESFYFYPVFACQIMNEGWASYWHARLLREADFLPQSDYVDAIKTHSDVVRPHASGNQASLSINPYHLGFCMWEKIIEQHGLERAFEIRAQDDDFSFVRNYLTEDLVEELKLFRYEADRDGTITVLNTDINELRDIILAPKYHFGSPSVIAQHVDVDGTLHLIHEHETDGRGLDLGRSEKVLDYVHRVWRRPIRLQTVDANGAQKTLVRPAA
jgi:stage V sporulation protein R